MKQYLKPEVGVIKLFSDDKISNPGDIEGSMLSSTFMGPENSNW